MLLNCGVGGDSLESLGLQGDSTIHSEGDQSGIFIGRTDAEAETPILWPSDVKNREDPLEKGLATHSSIIAWRIPWTEEPGGLQSMGLLRVRHD